MRICIYGAGAMGIVLGAFLNKAGIPADLITRDKPRVDALNRSGAHVVGGANFCVPVKAYTPGEMTGKYDVVILLTKQKGNAETARFLGGYLAADGALVCMQNGLPERVLAEQLGKDRIYGCVLSWGATAEGKAVSRLTSDLSAMRGILGAYGGGRRAEEIGRVLSAAMKITLTDNLKEARFAKLAINASFSTLSALTGMTFGEIARKRKTSKLAAELMKEVFSVAKAAGCTALPVQGHDLLRLLDYRSAAGKLRTRLLLPIAMKKHKNLVSGMLVSLEQGRRCEIDEISGAVVREGKRLGVPVPVQERAVALVHDIENGFAELSYDTVELFD